MATERVDAGAIDITAEEIALGPRALTLWRPAQPQHVQDPDAERGTAGPVWAHLWTSGLILAATVALQPLAGVPILELGCGLGLVGLAAAAAGGQVTVSDRSRYALAFAAVNAEHNDLDVQAVRCDWKDPTPLAALGTWPLVLGADVVYHELNARRLLGVLDQVVAPAGEVWLADPGRTPARAFLAAASPDWRVSSRAAGNGVVLHRLSRLPHA